jgi:hypothetical protein
MTLQQKRRLLLYGFLLSALHFTAAILCKDARLHFHSTEELVRSGKPYWGPHPLTDTLQKVGDILRLPAEWLWIPALPDMVSILLFVTNSCLWGFSLATLFRFVFLRYRHRSTPS